MTDNAPKAVEPVKAEPAKVPEKKAPEKAGERKALYRVIAGKVYTVGEDGKNSVHHKIGSTIKLTEREAHARANQVTLAVVPEEVE